MPKFDPSSFVNGAMRKVAMKLHTRDQSPKEGEKETQGKKFTEWRASRAGYLQFLVDSLAVYRALERVVEEQPALAALRKTGLERAGALEKDIAWMTSEYPELSVPATSEQGLKYAAFLEETAQKSIPAFLCHFYNHYFAHTAGGLMIGKMVSTQVLDGVTLNFYKWEGDVRKLLENVRTSIDAMAEGWSPEEKEECLEETGRAFQYGGSLLKPVAGQ